MIMCVCAVFDSAVQAYGKPVVFRTRAEAVRSFSDEVNRAGDGEGLHAHPSDYELRQLAEYDDVTGVFVVAYQVLVRGKDVSNDASK